MSKPGLFLWKKALKRGREYFVNGCLKQDKMPGKRVFHTSDLEKVFSFRGLQGTRDIAPGPNQGLQKATRPPLSGFFYFPPFLCLSCVYAHACVSTCMRMCAGRRFKDQSPGAYRSTLSATQPVVVEGHWQDATAEEQDKLMSVNKLQACEHNTIR